MISEAEFTDLFLGFSFVRVNGNGRVVQRAPKGEPLRRFDYPGPGAPVVFQVVASVWKPSEARGQKQVIIWVTETDAHGARAIAEWRFDPRSVEELERTVRLAFHERQHRALLYMVWLEREDLRPMRHVVEAIRTAETPADRTAGMRVFADQLLEAGIPF
jgi:hypothetical protein